MYQMLLKVCAASMMVAAVVSADVMTLDDVAEKASVTVELWDEMLQQNPYRSSVHQVGSPRYDVSRAFDGIVPDNVNNQNFYSMGLSGSLQLDLDEGYVFSGDADVTTFEVTWNHFGTEATGNNEAAELLIGNESGFTSLGYLANNSDALKDMYRDHALVLEAGNEDVAKWSVTLAQGDYTSLRLVDVSRSAFRSTHSGDGFDIGEIQYSSASVPEPNMVALMVAGLLSMALFAGVRREKNV